MLRTSLLVIAMTCFLYGHAQLPDTRVTLRLEHTMFKKFVDTLESTGRFSFNYPGHLDQYPLAHLEVDSATPAEAVQQALKGLPLGIGQIVFRNGKFIITLVSLNEDSLYNTLPEDTIAYDNGIQKVKAAFAVGAYSTEDRADLQRVIDRNLIAHLQGQMSGLTMPGPANNLGVAIRGNNSLLGPGTPLLVYDRLSFTGNKDDINIYDLDSAAQLSDAVSAGMYGAYSGNGVIVLTPRGGKYDEPLSITATTNYTFGARPNLGYQPRMSTGNFLKADSILFAQSFFAGHVNDVQFVIPPDVELRWKAQQGQLDPHEAEVAIANMARHNVLQDMNRYFYRNDVMQEYHLSFEGGTPNSKFYGSGGYVADPTAQVRNRYRRYTLHGSYTFRTDDQRLELNVSGNLAIVNILDNNSGDVPTNFPYAALADASGHPLAVPYKYNPMILDSVGSSYPADWHYRPLQELALADNRAGRRDGYVQVTASYRLFKHWLLETSDRLTLGHAYSNIIYNKDGFFVRNLYNSYAQPVEGSPGSFTFPIPDADIRISADTSVKALDGRLQLHFEDRTPSGNLRTALLGASISDAETNGQTQRIYGHNGPPGSMPMDFATYFPIRITGGSAQIPTDEGQLELVDRAVSVFSNAAYTWHTGYTLYTAFRLDASNIVGISNARKWAPFYSVGAGRTLKLATPKHLATGKPTLLKLRISFGSNGNVANRMGGLVTQYLGNNAYGAPMSGILSPLDPSLGWEKAYIGNAGADYGILRDSASPRGRIFGTLDIYQRWSVNLLSYDTLSLSSGVHAYTGNSAAIISQGLDLALHTVNTRGRWKWNSALFLTVTRDWVSSVPYDPRSPSAYVQGGFPEKGRPSTALFSFQWAGLDPATGDPQGMLHGQISKQYSLLMNDSTGGRVFSGRWQPTVTTSLLNEVTIGRFTLSFLFDLRTGYSIRRSSMQYYQFAMGYYPGNNDYADRWQVSGDEKRTNVPSQPTPANLDINRDIFYSNSQVLVVRADNLRWRDFKLCYLWQPKKKALYKAIEWYAYVNNIAILWRANHYHIDPDAVSYGQMPAVRTYSVGVSIKI